MTAGEWKAAKGKRVAEAAGAGPAQEPSAFYILVKEPQSVINQVSTRGFFPCVFFLLF